MIAFFKKLFGISKPQLVSESVNIPSMPTTPFNLDLEPGELVVIRKSIHEVVSCGQISSISIEPIRGYSSFRSHFHNIGSGIMDIEDIRFKNGIYAYEGTPGIIFNLYACKATPEEYELAKAQILCANKVWLYKMAAKDLGAAIEGMSIEELEKLHRELEYFYPMLDGIRNRNCATPKEEV